MGADDFSLDAYRTLLADFAARGYRVRSFEAADPEEPHLILRHDLDMSLQAALPVAEIEAAAGVAATYFVLLRTEMYNPWSADGRAAIAALAGLGHDIGLHFDASHYGPGDDLDSCCAAECGVLEAISGRPVGMVSFHRPVRALQGDSRPVGGRPHAYQPRWFRDMGYCSDSRGAWHYGHPLKHPAVAERRALQLLTHPIWWATSGPDPVAKLDGFVATRDEVLRNALAANCEPYAAARRERE